MLDCKTTSFLSGNARNPIMPRLKLGPNERKIHKLAGDLLMKHGKGEWRVTLTIRIRSFGRFIRDPLGRGVVELNQLYAAKACIDEATEAILHIIGVEKSEKSERMLNAPWAWNATCDRCGSEFSRFQPPTISLTCQLCQAPLDFAHVSGPIAA